MRSGAQGSRNFNAASLSENAVERLGFDDWLKQDLVALVYYIKSESKSAQMSFNEHIE